MIPLSPRVTSLPIYPRFHLGSRENDPFDGESSTPADPAEFDTSRNRCNLDALPRLYFVVAALLLCLGMGRSVGADPPASGAPPAPPQPQERAPLPGEVIILNDADDIGEFWKKLNRPDLIMVKPGSDGTAAGKETAQLQTSPRSQFISSVKIRGRIENDLADLQIELEVGLLSQGPQWVPIGLDRQIITSARERDRELELRSVGQGRWEVRVEGQGTHTLQLGLRSPVEANPERKRLQFALPLAPSTYLDVEIPRAVDEVRLESGESIGKMPLPAGKGTRVKGFLTPRSRLRLEWREGGDSGTQPAPILAAQGEIEIDADSDRVMTRSTWVIRCVRGTARKLELRLDEQDIVSRLELDDQPIGAGIEHNLLTIPLPEPLRSGASRRLLLDTRRTFPPAAPRRFAFTGFPLTNAGEQSGAIAVILASNLWIDVKAAHGLRRIDPRFLPPALRLHPATSMAFQFLDQSYSLDLRIEPSPPLYRSETRTAPVA